MAIKQTAGMDTLGDFAPKFAQLNDDVLFGEVWSREGELSLSRPQRGDGCGPDGAGADGLLVPISSYVRKEQRRDQDGDSGNPYACGVLRGMAQGVGGLSHGEGGLGR